MPYIKQSERNELNLQIKQLADRLSQLSTSNDGLIAGRLNYTITKLVLEYYQSLRQIQGHFKITYSDWNEILGALECCKLELYRKHIAPYEDEKIEQNGDVKVDCEK